MKIEKKVQTAISSGELDKAIKFLRGFIDKCVENSDENIVEDIKDINQSLTLVESSYSDIKDDYNNRLMSYETYLSEEAKIKKRILFVSNQLTSESSTNLMSYVKKLEEEEEDKVWENVQNEHTITSYENYINEYPNSKHKDVVQSKIKQILIQEQQDKVEKKEKQKKKERKTILLLVTIIFLLISYLKIKSWNSHKNPLPEKSSLDIGLVAYYPFNDNTEDISGNNYHGIKNGFIRSIPDRNNKNNSAFEFNGQNSITIKCPEDSKLNLSNNFTIAYWMAMSKVQGKIFVIITKGHGDPQYAPFSGWVMQSDYRNAKNGVQFVCADSEGKKWEGIEQTDEAYKHDPKKYVIGNELIDDGAWHFICIKKSESFGIVCYVDGNSVLQLSTCTQNIHGQENYDLTFGKDNFQPEHRYFSGKLDDIRIYNRILSDSEIMELYKLN